MSNVQRLPDTPLPATREEMLGQRTIKSEPTLNDYVDQIHVVMWDQETYPDYHAFLSATGDDECIEGSQKYDDGKAAEMIREYAREHGFPLVANKKIATLVRALKVVLRRYNMARHQRRNMVDGQTVPNGDNE